MSELVSPLEILTVPTKFTLLDEQLLDGFMRMPLGNLVPNQRVHLGNGNNVLFSLKNIPENVFLTTATGTFIKCYLINCYFKGHLILVLWSHYPRKNY